MGVRCGSVFSHNAPFLFFWNDNIQSVLQYVGSM